MKYVTYTFRGRTRVGYLDGDNVVDAGFDGDMVAFIEAGAPNDTLWNDMSARDTQTKELPVGMGPCKAKDWDGSNVLGPCIVTPDEIDAGDTHLRVRVNGEEWGADTTANMHHTFADMIAYASQDLTLRPGEVIGSGTAAGGSGLELDRWLKPGDVIEMEADKIGILRNRVGARASA